MRLSIIIPVYREPRNLEDLVDKLEMMEYDEKEILIAIDGFLTPQIYEAIKRLQSKYSDIKIVKHGKHLGKVKNLNETVKNFATGDILVFFDNDIILPERKDFLKELVKEFEKGKAIVEFPKVMEGKGILGKMIYYEFLLYAVGVYIVSKLTGMCPSMNGSAFAVLRNVFCELGGFRKVVNEDMDFAGRVFAKGYKFGYPINLKVRNLVPSKLNDWWEQRKRWIINNALWLKNFWQLLISYIYKFPNLITSFSIFLIPTLAYIISLYLFSYKYFDPISLGIMFSFSFYKILPSLAFYMNFVYIILFFSFLEKLIPFLISLLLSTLIYLIFSKKLGFYFNLVDFLIFSIFYTPLWLIMNLVGIFIILIVGERKIVKSLNWKVD